MGKSLNMNDNEAIKALERLKNRACGTMLYYRLFNDERAAIKYALDLIARQKAENAELQRENAKLKAELLRAKNDIFGFANETAAWRNIVNDVAKEAETEAYRELAEKIKTHIQTNKAKSVFFGDLCFIDEETVDYFVAELIGEKNYG